MAIPNIKAVTIPFWLEQQLLLVIHNYQKENEHEIASFQAYWNINHLQTQERDLLFLCVADIWQRSWYEERVVERRFWKLAKKIWQFVPLTWNGAYQKCQERDEQLERNEKKLPEFNLWASCRHMVWFLWYCFHLLSFAGETMNWSPGCSHNFNGQGTKKGQTSFWAEEKRKKFLLMHLERSCFYSGKLRLIYLDNKVKLNQNNLQVCWTQANSLHYYIGKTIRIGFWCLKCLQLTPIDANYKDPVTAGIFKFFICVNYSDNVN